MKKTIGILAHVDAGKTTFSEQLFCNAGVISKAGRVDHKNSFLDDDDIEKKRGITIYFGQGYFEYNDSKYYILDTPGHIDFSSEMERAFPILDYAVLIVSAVEGVQAHTETIWEYLDTYNIPTFIFINKIDRVGAVEQNVLKHFEENFNIKMIDLKDIDDGGQLSGELIESIAELKDEWLEGYLNDDFDNEIWQNCFTEAIRNRKVFPYISGSALKNNGVESFFSRFDRFTSTAYNEDSAFGGKVYKVVYDKDGARWSYIKAYTGQIKVRDYLKYGADEINEKITEIVRINGRNRKKINQIKAGELAAIRGLSETRVGQGVGILKSDEEYEIYPVLKTKVKFISNIDPKLAYKYFKFLDDEDPSLQVFWNEDRREIYIHTMGEIQLEVLKESIMDRFKVEVSFDEPEIIYKETIVGEVIGSGHFEPLKHYAEVQLKIESGERGSGILFENKCHADDLSIGYQNLVKQHVFERKHRGVLTGSELTDVKITLLTGKSHNKHTEGGDFREATYRAIRQGLKEAKSKLLEPYYKFKIKVPSKCIGKLLSDLQILKADSEEPILDEDYAIVSGIVPVSKFRGYEKKIAIYTSGRGVVNLKFEGYRDCHDENEIIGIFNYDANNDEGHSPDSIFCSKGKHYKIAWNEAKKYMHTVLK
jgi:small GTP-binding protein